MAKVTRLSDRRPVEVRQQEWLERYPNRFLACRVRHAWPDLLPGKALKRTRLEPWHDPQGQRQGCYYLEQTCGNCGRVRWRITGEPGQFYYGATQWQYADPRGYATPPGLGLTKGDYMETYFERLILGEQDLHHDVTEQRQIKRRQT